MNKKIKIKIVGLLLAGSISAGGGVLVGDTMLKRAEVEALYEQVKSEVFTGYIRDGMVPERGDALILVRILSREAKEENIGLENITDKNIVLKMIRENVKRIK